MTKTDLLRCDCLLQETVLLNMLEDESSTHHVRSYQDDDSNLGEHERQKNLHGLISLQQSPLDIDVLTEELLREISSGMETPPTRGISWFFMA